MKQLSFLILVFACNVTFGQAMSMPSNTMQYREYAQNAEPIGHKTLDQGSTGTAAVSNPDYEQLFPQSNGAPQSTMSIPEIKALLDERIALAQNQQKERSYFDEPDQLTVPEN